MVNPLICRATIHFLPSADSITINATHWPSAWPKTNAVSLSIGRAWFPNVSLHVSSVSDVRHRRRKPLDPLPQFHLSVPASLQLTTGKSLTLHVHFEPETQHLRIGPWATVVTQNTRLEHSMYGKQLAQACVDQAIGLSWCIYPSPFPTHADVLYNRIGLRQVEQSSAFHDWMKDAQRSPGLHVFNSRFLNKAEVDQIIRADPVLARHRIPAHILETGIARSEIRHRLESDLQQSHVFFLKPVHGSGGRGIWRIRVVDRTQPMWEIRQMCPLLTKDGHNAFTEIIRLVSTTQLIRAIASRVKRQSYLWQWGITPATIDRRPYDLRLLVQKNGHRAWEVSSAVARIARKAGDWLCNVQQGARTRPASSILTTSQIKQAHALALHLAQTLEKQLNWSHPPAEWGLDFIRTTEDQLYLLEVNAKPSKLLSDELTTPVQSSMPIPKSIRLWGNYVLALTGMIPALPLKSQVMKRSKKGRSKR